MDPAASAHRPRVGMHPQCANSGFLFEDFFVDYFGDRIAETLVGFTSRNETDVIRLKNPAYAELAQTMFCDAVQAQRD